MKKITALLLIAASTVLSVIIAMAFVNYGAVELGALGYLFAVVLTGIATILLFLLADHFFNRKRAAVTFALVAINILVGILMRMDFYWHFGIF